MDASGWIFLGIGLVAILFIIALFIRERPDDFFNDEDDLP